MDLFITLFTLIKHFIVMVIMLDWLILDYLNIKNLFSKKVYLSQLKIKVYNK